MSQNISDTAYIHTYPNCIGEHAIKARGEIFAHIAEIAEEMGTIAQTTSNDAENPRKLRAGDWYQNVVSILGERGSGKTILLLSAHTCLGRNNASQDERIQDDDIKKDEAKKYEKTNQKVDNDILLPIIQPEYFGPEDTLITWILTFLREYVEDKSNEERFKKIEIKQNDEDEHEVGISTSEFIDRLRHDETLFSRKFSFHLAEQDVTTSDFQLETLAVVDAHARFMLDWKKLVNKLIVKNENKRDESKATDRKNHPFLIIPIDDADLNPAALPVILQQLQILQHPNVLFLFSAHEKSLRSMMYISQLELNTNRADTRPVVNFTSLIKQGLRDAEDVRIDTTNKIEKILPRKYQVKIQPLSPRDRLNFKPLVKTEQNDKNISLSDDVVSALHFLSKTVDCNKLDGLPEKIKKVRSKNKNEEDVTPTFLQLLEKIPLDIFGDRRYEKLSHFFDLSQFFKRCPFDGEIDCKNTLQCKKDCHLKEHKTKPAGTPLPYCKVCELCSKPPQNSKEQLSQNVLFCQNKATYGQESSSLSSPIPSIYVDALPKYPRAMEQVYKNLNRCVEDILPVYTQYKQLLETDTDVVNTERQGRAKELREKISHAVKALLTSCLGRIPLLPHAFEERIKFVENPNPTSKRPILIEFETDHLHNLITASGDGIEIFASESGGNAHILSIHAITNHVMTIPGKIIYNKGNVENPHHIPSGWKFHGNRKLKNDEMSHIKEAKLYRVPDEYFAIYNLAHDLTTRNMVFGSASNSEQYQMRDGSPVSIFSVQDTSSYKNTDCYCAMPRWYRIANFNLFALAWNNLVLQVGEIIGDLSLKPGNHDLSDWVVLSLFRIHVCFEMNYSPFVVAQEEVNIVRNNILAKAKEESGRNQEEIGAIQSYDNLIEKIQKFVHIGFASVMEHIKIEAGKRVLPRHHRAFKTWVEYGLPMLSNERYVSGALKTWITERWIELLILINAQQDVCSQFERVNEQIEQAKKNTKELELSLEQHSSLFFFQEIVTQQGHYDGFIVDSIAKLKKTMTSE